jgi:hypothetical protein
MVCKICVDCYFHIRFADSDSRTYQFAGHTTESTVTRSHDRSQSQRDECQGSWHTQLHQ